MPTHRRLAVIAAGGFATRLGDPMPKSLQGVRGTTYLEMLLRELVLCDLNQVIVYSNRLDYFPAMRSILERFPAVELRQDEGVRSTAELFLAGTRGFIGEALFFYGHAPRTAPEIKRLLAVKSESAVCYYGTSSKRCPLLVSSRGFIEPPFKFTLPLMLPASQMSWRTLLNHPHSIPAGIAIAAPSEFNDRAERMRTAAHFSHLAA